MKNDEVKSDIIALSEAEVGKRYQVVNIKANGAVHQRMMDMGLVPGSRLWVIRYAPLGDPIEIRVRHFLMSLRKDEAKDVEVVDLGYHHSHHHMNRSCQGHGKGQGRAKGLSKDFVKPGKGWLRNHRWKIEEDE